MRALPLLLALLFAAPLAAAHHPGSVHGLDAYEPLVANMVHRLGDVQDSFAAWDADHPDLVERRVIGATAIGTPLETIRITDESVAFDEARTATGEKIRIYLDGGHHGNEFLGVDLVMYYLEGLLDGSQENAAFLQTHEVWATPIINPDGNHLDTRKNIRQVDVNRNYGFQFGGPGSGDNIFDLNYRGPAAFSEPEVLANAEFARQIMPDLWITMHTGVAEFYWPWGWTFDKSPDWEFFESLEGPFENATNGAVDAMMAAELYLAAGATDDWGYGQLGVPTHTYEVHDDQFVPIYGQPVPDMIQDQLGGLDFMVRNAMVMGAWISPHMNNGEFHVFNAGWGKATNVTVDWNGGEVVIPEIGPGEMAVYDAPFADEMTIAYKQLLIDAPEAKTRTVHFQVSEEDPTVTRAESPGVGAAVLLAALAALAVTRRRP